MKDAAAERATITWRSYGWNVEPIETSRLILEPWAEADREPFAALTVNPLVMTYIGDGETWDRQRANDVFERQLQHWAEHGFGWRSAIQKKTSQRIGFVAINHVGPEATEITEDEVEIGWWLHPSVWRQGLAKEGAFALRDEAFERVGLQRLIGRYQPANVASGCIMSALGMTFERDAIGRHGDVVRILVLHRERWLELSR